jgi:hypothetical protein
MLLLLLRAPLRVETSLALDAARPGHHPRISSRLQQPQVQQQEPRMQQELPRDQQQQRAQQVLVMHNPRQVEHLGAFSPQQQGLLHVQVHPPATTTPAPLPSPPQEPYVTHLPSVQPGCVPGTSVTLPAPTSRCLKQRA